MNAEKFLLDWVSLLDLDNHTASSSNMGVTLMYMPKRLPRKIKKRYKNNDKRIVSKINAKYPKYTFKNCAIEYINFD